MTRASKFSTPRRGPKSGFTLVELLVVLGVIAALAAVTFAGLRGSDQGVALRTAQATLATALNATRQRAVAKGVNVALMVHNDPAAPARYRRLLAVVESVTTAPVLVAVYELPRQSAVLPNRSRFTDDMRAAGDWTGGYSGNALGSTLLGATIAAEINGPVVENWEYREVTPNGTVAGAGSLIAGIVRPNPGGAYPLLFVSPEQVRGLTVSSYALARTINDRQGF